MNQKVEYRTKYNAHGQVEQFSEPVVLYEVPLEKPNSVLQAIYAIINLVTLGGVVAAAVWVGSIIK